MHDNVAMEDGIFTIPNCGAFPSLCIYIYVCVCVCVQRESRRKIDDHVLDHVFEVDTIYVVDNIGFHFLDQYITCAFYVLKLTDLFCFYREPKCEKEFGAATNQCFCHCGCTAAGCTYVLLGWFSV